MKWLRHLLLLIILCYSSLSLGAEPDTYQQITDLSTAQSLTIPGDTYDAWAGCIVQAEGGTLRWLNNGTAPTATTGMQIVAGSTGTITERLSDVQIVAEDGTSTPTANIIFYYGPGVPSHSKVSHPPTVIQVVAFDGPSWMRAGGAPDRYLCPDPDVTAATATIQKAIDAAAVQVELLSGVAYKGGAIVELSGGTFNLDKSATAGDEVSGRGTVSKATAPLNGTLTGAMASIVISAYDASWDIDDIATGQMYDLREGDRGAGVSMDDDYERFVGMCGGVTGVAADDAGDIAYVHATTALQKAGIGTGVSAGDFVYLSAGTFGAGGGIGWYEVASATANEVILTGTDPGDGNQADFETADAFSVYGGMHASYDYATAVFTRVVSSLYLKKGVHLRGAGSTSISMLLLDDNQDCAVIQIEVDTLGGFVQRGFKISDLTINGNEVGQTAGTEETSHGLVASYNAQTITLDNVSIGQCLGDGAWFNVGEFVRVTDCTINGNGEYGLCFGGGGPAYVRDSALFGNGGPGLYLHRTSSESIVVSGCSIRTDGADWGAVATGTVNARFLGNYFGPTTKAGATELGGIYISSDSASGVIAGNHFQNRYGTAINNQGYRWAITGNHIRSVDGSTPYQHNTSQFYPNAITGNVGMRQADEQAMCRAQNTTGGTLTQYSTMVREAGKTVNDTVLSSARNDRVLGSAFTEFITTLDDDWYYIVRVGRAKALVDDDDTLAVGDPLCASAGGGDNGVLTLADTAGDLVVAIAEATTVGDGTTQTVLVVFLLPEDRYIVP